MPSLGTRNIHASQGTQPVSSHPHSISTRDLELAPLVTASMTFATGAFGAINVTAANGTFVNFAKDQQIELIGTGANDGCYKILGVDAANNSYLKLSPSVPANLGPLTATMRTI